MRSSPRTVRSEHSIYFLSPMLRPHEPKHPLRTCHLKSAEGRTPRQVTPPADHQPKEHIELLKACRKGAKATTAEHAGARGARGARAQPITARGSHRGQGLRLGRDRDEPAPWRLRRSMHSKSPQTEWTAATLAPTRTRRFPPGLPAPSGPAHLLQNRRAVGAPGRGQGARGCRVCTSNPILGAEGENNL